MNYSCMCLCVNVFLFCILYNSVGSNIIWIKSLCTFIFLSTFLSIYISFGFCEGRHRRWNKIYLNFSGSILRNKNRFLVDKWTWIIWVHFQIIKMAIEYITLKDTFQKSYRSKQKKGIDWKGMNWLLSGKVRITKAKIIVSFFSVIFNFDRLEIGMCLLVWWIQFQFTNVSVFIFAMGPTRIWVPVHVYKHSEKDDNCVIVFCGFSFFCW